MPGVKRVRLVVAVTAVLVAVLVDGSAAGAAEHQEADPAPTEGGGWRQVSTGYYHTCAIRLDRSLYCWGQNNHRQLGNANPANATTPVRVGLANDWKSVSAGSAWTCAVKTTGTLWCFGRDDYGQLGNGPATTGDQATPVQVGTATDWKSVSAGLGETTCGRRANKRIYCWGRDNNGQVGNGPGGFGNVESPSAVGTNADWSSVSAGGYHVCGRRTNGRVYCWGDDLDGAVGDGGSAPGTDRSVPTEVAGGHADWTSVASGITHSCGRRSSGRLYCWGSDIDGGLGNGGANTNRYSPGQVAGNATDWKTVNAGSYVTCATKASGRLFCWGDDFYGQVGSGVGDQVDNSTPTQVAGNATNWKYAVMGNYHTCAFNIDGRVYCWGYGFFGQRGDGVSGNNNAQPTPTEVP